MTFRDAASGPTRRDLLALAGLAPLGLAGADADAALAAPPKVLRYAFRVAETGFDPARISDLYSRIITAHIFEGLYTYDHLARPALLRPLVAEGMPEVSEDFKVWTMRVRPGIYFAADKAFRGQPRELVAEDFVYSWKRFADPEVASPSWSELDELGILGLAEYRAALLRSKAPFDYDHPIEGLRALDRYTLQIRLKETRPRLMEVFAQIDTYGAVAREVIEHYPGTTMEHPVGTGPFVLGPWRRSSLITLNRNPGYRERFYDAQPAPDDREGQALLARFKGRRLPMIDQVQVAIIEESQPRWLSFLNRQFDFLERTPEDFIQQVLPRGQLAPNLASQGIQAYRALLADVLFTVFNMDDPVVGGYTPARVALRRAIALATDCRREINLARRGQAIPAQSPYLPHTTAYDATYKSEMGDFDPARAKALLDLYGYRDRDGDGWREDPDGRQIVLESLTTPDGFQRQIDEIWQKNLAAVGLRVQFRTGKWPENFKALRAGHYMIWSLAVSAAKPDSQDALASFHSGHVGASNYARFRHEAMDRLFEQAGALPDGAQRQALFNESKRLATAYMPYKYRGHRYVTDLAHPWVQGYRRPLFQLHWWECVDVVGAPRVVPD